MTTSWQIGPIVEVKKQKSNEAAAQKQQRLLTYATAVRAQNIALGADLNPTLSAEALVAADAAGLTAEDPMLQEIAAIEQEQTGMFGTMANVFDEAVWDPVKGATRWLGMGFEGLYDEILSRPIRTTTNMVSHGMGLEEAYRGSGDAAFGAFGESLAGTAEALQQGDYKAALGLDGKATNQGEGIFADSDLSMEVQQELAFAGEMANTIGGQNDTVTNEWGYQHYGSNFARLSVNQRKMMYLSGRRDEIMEQASDPSTNLGATQQAFGTPTTEKIRAEAESVLFYSDSIPWNKGDSGLGVFSQVSPGRIFATMVTEPGTTQNHWMSGIIDAGMQIFGDPADLGLGAGVRAAKASRALGLSSEGIRLAQDNTKILNEARTQLKTVKASEEYTTHATKAQVTQDYGKVLADRPDLPVTRMNERSIALQAGGRSHAEAARLQASITDLEKGPNVAEAVKRSAGVLNGSPRKDVMPIETTQFLTGRTATPFVENFTRSNTLEEVDALLSHVKTPIPRKVRSALAEADNNAEVVGLLLPHVGGAITETGLALVPSLTGGLIGSPTAALGRGMANINPFVNTRKTAFYANNGMRTNNKMLYNGSALSRRFSEIAPATMDLNDLDRSYDDLAKLGKNLGLKRQETIQYKVGEVTKNGNLDDIMGRFTRITDGDFVGAYNVLEDFMSYAFTSLSEAGLNDNVAAAITKFTAGGKDDALWFTNRVGDIVREPNAATKVLADGQEIVNPGPQLITELFNGNVMFPDHNLIRRAVAETDVLGKITNSLALKGKPGMTRKAAEDFDQRWMLKAADNALAKVWKPLVLIRFAWPLRVIGEEQTRMSAAGFGSMFTIAPGAGHHPLSYWAMAMTRTPGAKMNVIPDAVRKRVVGGRTMDVLGDDITRTEEFIAAMSKRSNFDGEVGARGSTYWGKVNKFDQSGNLNPRYLDGLTTELNQLWSDPVVHRLFDGGNAGLTDADKITDTIRWMREDGAMWTNELGRNAPPEVRNLLGTDEGMRAYLEGVYARAHLKAGGEYRYILADGSFITDAGTMGKLNEVEKATWAGTSGYEIIRPGNSEILEAYATGKLNGLNIRKTLGEVGEDGTTNMAAVQSYLRKLIKDEGTSGGAFPYSVKSNKFIQDDVSNVGETYNKVVNRLFEWSMSRPTNRLSRSPAFRDSYWQRMGDLMPHMDEATQKAAREGADAANMGTVAEGWRVSKRSANASAAGRGVDGGTITSLDQADELAKAYALTEVEDLLYDLSKKHNVSEAMSIMMPFVEAYGEVSSTWAKLMTQQWGRPGRRFQQVIESGRESDPFNPESGYTSGDNDGFFHDDQYGNEVFSASLPVPGAIGRALGADEGQFNFSLQGVNFLSTVIPGFGPAVQVPANLFLPESPEWQGIRDLISPFGGNQGNLVSSSLPSWMKRGLFAFDKGRDLLGTDHDQEMFSNAVIDVLRSRALEDPEGFKEAQADPERNAEMLNDAKNEARNLYLVRSLATFVGPTSPSFEPQAEDKDGRLWAYGALGQQYRKLLDMNEGDHLATTQAFVTLFGIDPAPLQEGKTASIVPRSSIAIGHNFQKEEGELFEQYPSTAFFLGPARLEGAGEFDYPAYYAQKLAGTRLTRTPEEWTAQLNDFYGELAYDTMEKRALTQQGVAKKADLTDGVKAYLNKYNVELQQQFPGYVYEYGAGVAGAPEYVDNSVQRAEIAKMIKDPELVERFDVLKGATNYLAIREDVDARIRGLGFVGVGTTSTDGQVKRLKQWLRIKGTEMGKLYPDFAPLYESVYAGEVREVDEMENADAMIAQVVGSS